ncbi:AAA family ATPase [Enterobacter hormaechei]
MLINELMQEISTTTKNDGKKIFYIIGNNGTGKSMLLNEIANKASQDKTVNKVLCISNTLYDKFKLENDKAIYLGLRTVNNAIFLVLLSEHYVAFCYIALIKYAKQAGKNLNMKFSIVFESGKKINDIGSYYDKRKTKNKHISDILSEREITIFLDMIGHEINFKELNEEQIVTLEKFLPLNPNSIKLKVKKDNGKFLFEDLSSGEQNRILLSSKVLSNIDNKCVIVIDEPEISLHLHWQIDFHAFLNGLISSYKGVSIFIASHSPILVSEAYKDKNVSTIIILGGQGRNHEYLNVQQSSNTNFENIVLDFFNTATYRSIAIDEEIARIITSFKNETESVDDSISKLESLKRTSKGYKIKLPL